MIVVLILDLDTVCSWTCSRTNDEEIVQFPIFYLVNSNFFYYNGN